MSQPQPVEQVLIIDAMNLIHPSFHGVKQQHPHPKTQEPLNALFGVVNTIYNLLDLLRPDYLFVAKEGGRGFRHELYREYKSNRGEMHDNLKSQLPYIDQFWACLGATTVSVSGFEADDVIASLTKQVPEGCNVYIYSNDKDLYQLIGKNVWLGVADKSYPNGVNWLDGLKVFEILGVSPKFVPLFKAMVGDPSDNLPGVVGIGPKKALNFIWEYVSQNANHDLSDPDPAGFKLPTTPKYNQTQLEMMLKLVTLVDDLDVKDLYNHRFMPDATKLTGYLKKFGFTTLANKFNRLCQELEIYQKEVDREQDSELRLPIITTNLAPTASDKEDYQLSMF